MPLPCLATQIQCREKKEKLELAPKRNNAGGKVKEKLNGRPVFHPGWKS
jgi:hypothetical protein